MAAPVIKIKRSSVPGKIPTTASLPLGELALNTNDGKVYIQQDSVGIGSTVIVVNPWSVGLGSNTYNTFFTAGSVGIGTTIPNYTLDVNGDINFGGILYKNGVEYISGIGIQSGGSFVVGSGVTILNFVGSAVSTITNSGSGIVEINVKAGQFARGTSTFTATPGQTSFSVNYTPNFIDVFLNGVRLTTSEFTATNGTSVILIDAAFVNDIIDVVVFQNSGLFDGSKWSAETPLTPSSGNIYRVSGNVGIGTTNPTSKLTVSGDVNVSGVVTATTFVGALNGTFTGTASSTSNIPNLTGAITSVNTTTSLGSFSSSNLATALTDKTGTGVAVFATSPTLVTPSLGIATATSINVSGSITATSGFVGNVTGTATSTTNIPNLSGDITSANTVTTLATVNSNVGTFGSSVLIPSITVNAKGLVTAVTTAAVGSGLTVTGDSGSENIDLLSEVLTISGGTNLTSSATSNTVTVNLDDNISLVSVVASGVITATSGFSGNVTGNVTGNLTGNINSSGVSTVTLLNATNINASGIVTAIGGFVGNVTGTATSTTNIPNLTGDISSVNTATTLATVNSNVGSFGSQTLIPVVTVNAKGLVTAVTTAAVGSGLTVTGDSGSENIDLLTEVLTISGGTNLTSSAASNTVTVNLDPNISLTSVVASGIVTATSGFVGNLTGTASSTTNIPNLTGAITSVNTTTSLGSFSSSNLSTALTDKTGTGVAVFATSPTLVTPVLGIATATSLNVSGIVTASSFVGSGANLTNLNIPAGFNELDAALFS